MTKRILVIEDDIDIADLVQDVLSDARYHVETCRIGSTAISMAEVFHPDLVLLDFRLGDGNGGDLCRELKAHPEFKNIPVIIFTAFTHTDINFYDFGCDAIIFKPFDIYELEKKIHFFLNTE